MSTDLGASWDSPGIIEDRPTVIFYTILSVGDRTYIGGSGGSIMGGTIDINFRPTGITSDVLTFADVSDSAATKVLAGTFGEEIIASTDGGSTWEKFGTGLNSPNVTSLLVTQRPASGVAARVLAATYGGGVNRSIDGGLSWTTANQGLTVSNVNQLCAAGGHIFAAGSGGNFFVSHDSGNSWQSIGAGLPETEILSLNVIISASDTLCLAGTVDAGVWVRSLNGGPWAAKNVGLGNLRINSIAVSDTLVLLGTHEGGYLSTDKGMTWVLVSKPTFPKIASMGAWVDPNDPLKARLIFGSEEWLALGHCPYWLARAFSSSNMGADWQTLPFEYARSFPSLYVRDSLAVFFSDGSEDCPSVKCYVSGDLGKTWVENGPLARGSGARMKAYEKVSRLGVNLFFSMLGPSAGTYISPDTGRSWQGVGEAPHSFVYPFAVSGTNLYGRTFPGSGYQRSTDFGETWEDITTSLNGMRIVQMETQGTKLYASAAIDPSTNSNGGVLVSADSAQNWSGVGFEGMSVPVMVTHDSLLFVVANGELYCSRDSSLTWTNVTSNLKGDSVYRVGFSKDLCFVSTSNGRELRYRQLSEILEMPGPVPGVPVLLSPASDSLVAAAPVIFAWSKPEFTRFFQFQLALDSTFATGQVVDSSGIADTTLVVQQLVSGVSYFWRVRSYNIHGYGAWSPVFSFRTPYSPAAIPVLVSPADSSLNQATELRLVWQRTPSAVKYHLQLWNMVNGFPSFSVTDSAIVDTQRVVDTLRTGTWYNWSVRAWNPSGYGMWSPVWHFRTIVSSPFQVSLISPPNGAAVSGDSVRLLWAKTEPEVSRYWVEGATDSLFVTRNGDSTVTDTGFVLRGLRGGFSYWWRVKAYNNAGWGPFSETRKFTVSITALVAQTELPKEYSLSQNYPNPFNPSTTIRYALPKAGPVRLEIFNTVGQRVALLVDGMIDAGYHEARFDGSGVSSGIYLYRLQAGDYIQVRKALLIK